MSDQSMEEEADEELPPTSSEEPSGFQFVEYEPGRRSRGRRGRSIVRSQAARHQWRQDLPARTAQRADRGRRRRPQRQIVFQGEEAPDQSPEDDSSSTTSTSQSGGWGSGGTSPSSASSSSAVLVRAGAPQPGSIEWLIEGTSIDPFQSFPTRSRSYYPRVVDHYLTRIAVNIPELDQAIPGYLRSNFFPLALTEPSTFLAIVLLSSSHYSAVGSTLGASNLLRLKQETLEAINEAMRRDQNLISDALIGTVAKMAAYEAMYGDPQTYLAHMAGLKRMIELRGGLSGLGLGGLLRRLILWIDTNAAFLIRVPLQFPGEVFAELQATIEPNPEHFIGRSN